MEHLPGALPESLTETVLTEGADMPRITIDEDLCVGTADCVRIAHGAFVIKDGDDVASVTAGAHEVPLVLLHKAAYDCPTGAITVDEDAAAH